MTQDLPDTTDTGSTGNRPSPNDTLTPTGGFSSGMSKEIGGIGIGPAEVPLEAIGTEKEPSIEVQKAGVKHYPQSMTIPPPVQKAGVEPIGSHEPTTVSKGTVQLSDQETVAGLGKKPETSWRWLAEFHKRQLLKIGILLRTIHGTIQRVGKGHRT